MAGQVEVNDQSFNAAVAINKYQAVVLDTTTAHQVTLPAALNAAKFAGIAQEDVDPTNYDPMLNVRMEGNSYAIADGAISVGDKLILSATAGQVHSVGAQATPNIVGLALEPAVNAGDTFLMVIKVGL